MPSYDVIAVEESLGSKTISDPTDLSFLISNLRELPEEARKYMRWAAMFGETCVPNRTFCAVG